MGKPESGGDRATTDREASPEESVASTLGDSIEESTQPEIVTVQTLQRIGHFVLLSELGRGGMGTVFAAYDERLDRKVAIKLLHRRRGPGDILGHRLRREAQAMARVSHPNVVSVYEVEEVNGQVFIAMEFIDGITLTRWQRQPGRTWQEILGMYLQAGRGLAAAHATGLVHRDFKPDNVLVSQDGRARVLDFGLARLRDRPLEAQASHGPETNRPPQSNTLTGDGLIAGTPGYMSPEQYGAEQIDARSDQFSFCAALFEALFGMPPFAGQVHAEIAGNTVAGRVTPPPRGSPVPEDIQRTLLRGLASRPEQRFPRMEELLHALFLETTDSAAAGAASRRRFVRWALFVWLLVSVAAQSWRTRHAFQYRQILPVSAVNISLVLGLGLLQRKTLLRNSYHRSMWVLLLVPLLLNLGQRSVGWRLGLSYQQVVPFELLSMGGVAAMGGALIARSLFLISGLMLGILIAVMLIGSAALPYTLPIYSFSMFWILWEWTKGGAAKRRAASAAASGPPGESPAEPPNSSPSR